MSLDISRVRRDVIVTAVLVALPLALHAQAPDPTLVRTPLPSLVAGGPGGGTAVVLGGRDGSDCDNPAALAHRAGVRVRVLHAESHETRTREARVEIALAGDYGDGDVAGIGIALGDRRRRFDALETGLVRDSVVTPTYILLGLAAGSRQGGWHFGVGMEGTAVDKGNDDQVNQFTYSVAADWAPVRAVRLTALTRPRSVRTGDVPTQREIVAAAELPEVAIRAPFHLAAGGGIEAARLVSGGRSGAETLRSSLFVDLPFLRVRGGAERDDVDDRTRRLAWNAGATISVRSVRLGVGRRFAPRGSALGDVTTVLVGTR